MSLLSNFVIIPVCLVACTNPDGAKTPKAPRARTPRLRHRRPGVSAGRGPAVGTVTGGLLFFFSLETSMVSALVECKT